MEVQGPMQGPRVRQASAPGAQGSVHAHASAQRPTMHHTTPTPARPHLDRQPLAHVPLQLLAVCTQMRWETRCKSGVPHLQPAAVRPQRGTGPGRSRPAAHQHQRRTGVAQQLAVLGIHAAVLVDCRGRAAGGGGCAGVASQQRGGRGESPVVDRPLLQKPSAPAHHLTHPWLWRQSAAPGGGGRRLGRAA